MAVRPKRPKAAPPGRKRVLLVDDHPVVRQGLAEVLNATSDLAVCGEAATAADARDAIERLHPDLAIVDLTLEDVSGLELLKDVRIRHPKLPVLVLSMHDETLFAERVLRAGARGYIMKQEAMSDLVGAVRRILDGKIYLSPRMSDRLLQTVARGEAAGSPSGLQRLSDRELEVFELIGHGHGTAAIARKLHLSVKTIETHRAHIKEKLDLPDAAQLVRHAVQWVQSR